MVVREKVKLYDKGIAMLCDARCNALREIMRSLSVSTGHLP